MIPFDVNVLSSLICVIYAFIQVTDAIHSLVSTGPVPKLMMQRVEKLFCWMDLNKDGVVDEEEFTEYCRISQELV